MDSSQLQVLATVVGLLLGVIIGVIGLATAWVNLRKARYEALKAGVPLKQNRLLRWLKLAYAWCTALPGRLRELRSSPNDDDDLDPELDPLFFAPGLIFQRRRNGTTVAYWQARHDAVELGFRPPAIPLWMGKSPSDFEREFVSAQCRDAQDAMLAWMRQRRNEAAAQADSTAIQTPA